jgi:hypothetical protein
MAWNQNQFPNKNQNLGWIFKHKNALVKQKKLTYKKNKFAPKKGNFF